MKKKWLIFRSKIGKVMDKARRSSFLWKHSQLAYCFIKILPKKLRNVWTRLQIRKTKISLERSSFAIKVVKIVLRPSPGNSSILVSCHWCSQLAKRSALEPAIITYSHKNHRQLALMCVWIRTGFCIPSAWVVFMPMPKSMLGKVCLRRCKSLVCPQNILIPLPEKQNGVWEHAYWFLIWYIKI